MIWRRSEFGDSRGALSAGALLAVFHGVSDFVGQVQEIYERQRSGQLEQRTEEEGKRDNEALYGRLAPAPMKKEC